MKSFSSQLYVFLVLQNASRARPRPKRLSKLGVLAESYLKKLEKHHAIAWPEPKVCEGCSKITMGGEGGGEGRGPSCTKCNNFCAMCNKPSVF